MSGKKLSLQTKIYPQSFGAVLYDAREYALDFSVLRQAQDEGHAETAARREFLVEEEFDRQVDVGDWVLSWYSHDFGRRREQ
jgi:hypothetical protein